MVEYLEQLVKAGKWAEAETYANQLLTEPDLTITQMAAIYCSTLSSRFFLRKYEAAVAIGPLAVSIAKESGSWEHHGVACIDLGASYYLLNKVEQALESWFEYISCLQNYSSTARLEARVWFNIATAYRDLGEPAKAIAALHRAIETANRTGNLREAHGYRHALVEAYMKAGELKPIPHLLMKCLHYLRTYPQVLRDSWLWHYKLRTDFALVTGRRHRAILTALKGIAVAGDEARMLHEFHMQLAEIQEERPETALGHLTAARGCAAACHRADLESRANERIHQLIIRHQDLSGRMERYYTGSEC